MITTRITFNGAKVRLGPGVGFKKYQMLALGQLALDTVKARVAKAVGSDDAAMKPLKERYAKWKEKIGLEPIRDLHGPGQTTYQARTYTKTPAQHFTGFKAWWNGLGFGGSANARFRQFHANHPVRMYTTRQANIRFRSAGGGAHMLDNFTVRYADELSVRMDISAQWARDRARANEQRAPWFGFSPNDIRAIAGLAQQMFQANVTDLAVQLRAVTGGAVWLNPNGLQDQMLKRFAA
jgi:hypothetical protein